jgi:hypothetical protein
MHFTPKWLVGKNPPFSLGVDGGAEFIKDFI